MIQRLGEYKDTKARCLALHVLTAYVSYYTTPSKKNGATSSNNVGGGLTKKYSFRNIMSDGNSKSLPQLLYEKGVYHLLYQNFSRQELNHNVEDIYITIHYCHFYYVIHVLQNSAIVCVQCLLILMKTQSL